MKIFSLVIVFFLCACQVHYTKQGLKPYGLVEPYGYSDWQNSPGRYGISFTANPTTPLRKTIDFALVRASEIALKKQQNFSINSIEASRDVESYGKNHTEEGLALVGVAFIARVSHAKEPYYHSSPSAGYNHAATFDGTTNISMTLSPINFLPFNACDLCTIITKKYPSEFKENFCSCPTDEKNFKCAEDFIKNIYSQYDNHFLDSSYTHILHKEIK